MGATIVWFRQDLRLHDNDALLAAVRRGAPIIPVYIADDPDEGLAAPAAASRSWLHRSLQALDAALRERGSRLIVGRGAAVPALQALRRAVGADAVYWARRYEPDIVRRDAAVAESLRADGVDVREFGGAVLFEPAAVRNRQGGPFQVFTPFWRTCLTLPVSEPVRLPNGPLPAPPRWPESLAITALGWQPVRRWDAGFYPPWEPGEAAARARLLAFSRRGLEAYADTRDQPGVDGTSQLSPHLHFGEISPRQVWAAVKARSRETGVFPPNRGATVFLTEIGWREFAYHLLVHFPFTPERPLRSAFAEFPWAADPGDRRWKAWRSGQTGYPIVDAGMRQLWQTGWMHNRVRMIVASFLVKHLRLPWTEGAAWFRDTLVDADLASNTLGWQWTAGCGADAAPYFRIFAPVTQGRKFDPDGTYIRRWVPELAALPTDAIHAPWEVPAVAAAAGIVLGRTYPQPIVDHATARDEALAAFKSLRSVGQVRSREG